jgi:hypothetical protein
VQQSLQTSTPPSGEMVRVQPQLIFATELESSALRRLLFDEGLLADFTAQQYGIAMVMHDLSEERAALVRQLNQAEIYIVAQMLLPASEGTWFNLQNYPQAVECYAHFRAWAQQHNLHFDAVGLDIKPPANEVVHMQHWRLRDMARRLWLARENVLYPAARAAYTELIAEMHHDGYEVHIYQLPLIADDQRAGSTMLQRALDVVDLPADLEILMCYSSLPIGVLGNDLGGALINSYGPSADSIGVGNTSTYQSWSGTGSQNDTTPSLSWEALERDLLLAANYTDTLYVFVLEGCVERHLMPRIASIDWSREPVLPVRRRLLVKTLRSSLLVVLLFSRFYRALLAWLGWVVALVLFIRQRRHGRRACD